MPSYGAWIYCFYVVCRAERKGLGEGIAARLQPPGGRSGQGLRDQKNRVIPQARTEAQSGVKSDLGFWRGKGRKASIEGDIVAKPRRELRIGLHAVEGAVELGRNRALDVQVGNVRLDPRRRVETGEGRAFRKLRHG